MFLLTALGASMVATSAIGISRNMPNTRLKILIRRYLDANKIDGVKLRDIHRHDNIFRAEMVLPYNFTAAQMQKHVPGLEQVTSSHIRFVYGGGPVFHLEFGYSDFKANMAYCPSNSAPLVIPLYSPFGIRNIDFRQETSCHLLVGGATRMGKTALIRLIATTLLQSTEGKIVVKMIDNKVNDLYMFKNVPQVTIAESEAEAEQVLVDAKLEMEQRKQLLKEYGDCVDTRELLQKHSVRLDPYFVIIDEYGRFADNDDIQKAVERLVETSGYLDMHVIIASQRPDAQTVLKARIKANLTTRICFTTMDEMNSKVVLDIPDAARLGKVQGRAILLDGFPEVVQVPHMTAATAKEIVAPYAQEAKPHVESERRTDIEDVTPFQSFEPQPIGEIDIPKPKKRKTNRKPRT